MTAPRQVLHGTTYMVTRRCLQRTFLLRPSDETNEIVRYVLALATSKYGVELHCACVMSNHLHLVVTDPHARLPAFTQYFDGLVARSVNAALGRWETFWAPASYSAVALETREAILDAMAYVLANPATAGLVQRGEEWPGVWSPPRDLGAPPTKVPRPAKFFRPGHLPDEVELAFVVPPGFESAEALRAALVERLEAREREAAEKLRREKRTVLGRRRVLAQSPYARPATREPRRGLKARPADDRWKKLEVANRAAEFQDAYAAARDRWVSGFRDVVFPVGTYLLRVLHAARCAPS